MATTTYIAPNELQSLLTLASRVTLTTTPRSSTTVTPADPGTLSSSTSVYKMAGCGVMFTPVNTSLLNVVVLGTIASDTPGDGAIAQITYGTGSAPAKNASATGTQAGAITPVGSGGTTGQSFVCMALFAVTPNTQYWLDLAVKAVTGGNGVLSGLTFIVAEY